MKLQNIQRLNNFIFKLEFINGEIMEVNLASLVKDKVNKIDPTTAKINADWQCLEFNNGSIDIEPKTLFEFSKNNQKLKI